MLLTYRNQREVLVATKPSTRGARRCDITIVRLGEISSTGLVIVDEHVSQAETTYLESRMIQFFEDFNRSTKASPAGQSLRDLPFT